MTPEREFYVGETIHLRSRISRPGTREPLDPEQVVLVELLRRRQVVLNGPIAFDRVAVGEWTLTLPTAAMQPGPYTVLVRHESGPENVVLTRESFVLVTA